MTSPAPAGDRPRSARITAQLVSTVRECPRRLWLQQHGSQPASPVKSHVAMLRERSRQHERDVAARFPALRGPLWNRQGSFEDAARESAALLAARELPLSRPALLSKDGRRSAVPGIAWWDGGELVLLEARLALRPDTRGDFALQFAHAVDILREAHGIEVRRCEVVNGNGETIVVRPASEDHYRSALREAEAVLARADEPDLLMPHSFCRNCDFYGHCWDLAERQGRIEILPEVLTAHLPHYHALGVRTLEQLASLDPATLPRGTMRIAAKRASRVASAWRDGRAEWLGSPQLPDRPLVWFDLEGDSRGEDAEIPIYLWGLALEMPGGEPREPRVEALFAEFEAGGDRRAWERFVARTLELVREAPGVLFVHWDQYEPLWIRRYLDRYDAPPEFRAHMPASCFDLKRVVDRCVRLPLRSYSIKHVAPWMGFQWRNPESGSEWSVAQFQRARDAADPAERRRLLDAIADYNADDLWAMRAVWRWLAANAPPAGGLTQGARNP